MESGVGGGQHTMDEMRALLETYPKPTVAAIEGRVGGGGCELALACSARFAAAGGCGFLQQRGSRGAWAGATAACWQCQALCHR